MEKLVPLSPSLQITLYFIELSKQPEALLELGQLLLPFVPGHNALGAPVAPDLTRSELYFRLSARGDGDSAVARPHFGGSVFLSRPLSPANSPCRF